MVALSAHTVKTSSDDDWDNLPRIPNEYYEYMRQLDQETMTAKIFALSAPYDNPYQSSRKRWLFVCSAGLLRSPTGAAVATDLGVNARSCGSSSYALIPLSVNLIMWAGKIFFVNKENYMDAMNAFEAVGYTQDIEDKAVILDIPDIYHAFDPILVATFQEELQKHL